MASESDTELTVEELRARYAAIRRRLYGVSGPTGVVPPVRLGEPLPEVKPPSYSHFRFAAPSRFVNLIIQVAKDHNIPPETIVDKTRKAAVVRARQDLFYRAHTDQHMSHSQIGRYMNCDHTTVMHGVKKHEKMLQDNGSSDTI
jgi:hypothetical protein